MSERAQARASVPSFDRETGKLVLRDLWGAGAGELGGWQPLREGVDILPLYPAARDEAGSGAEQARAGHPAAALLRYRPGASVPSHEHPGFEHIIVLSGAQRDEHGRYEQGSCVVSLPGTRHRVHSDEGCLVLAIWTEPVRFL